MSAKPSPSRGVKKEVSDALDAGRGGCCARTVFAAKLFFRAFPEVLRYNASQVVEQSTLFFALTNIIGMLFRYFVDQIPPVSTNAETLIRALVIFLSLFLIWLLQEKLAIWGYRAKDPLTLRRARFEPVIKEKPAHILDIKEPESPKPTPNVEPIPTKALISIPQRHFTAAQEESISVIIGKYFDPTQDDMWSRSKFLCVNMDGRAAAIRALDARRFKIDQASILIENNLKWREREGVDTIFDKVVPPADIRAIRVALSDGFFGVDRTGTPIYWSPAGSVQLSMLLKQVPLEHIVTYHIQSMEFNHRVWFKELTQQQQRCIYQATCVLDLKGFSSHTTRGGFMEIMTAITTIDKDFYYENLFRVYILNAPSFFRFFWNSVSVLLQPETRRKFVFLANPSQLHEYIDPDIIPKQFGGNYMNNDAIFLPDTEKTQYTERMDNFIEEWRRT